MASDGFSELSSYLSSDCSKIEYWRGTADYRGGYEAEGLRCNVDTI